MPGRIYTELLDLAQDQHGYLRAEDVREAGFDPKRLVDYQRRGVAERVAYGVYRMKGIPSDELEEYMRAALWPMGVGVLSHETALDLYELCDVNPAGIDVTVPHAYRTHRPVPALYRLTSPRPGKRADRAAAGAADRDAAESDPRWDRCPRARRADRTGHPDRRAADPHHTRWRRSCTGRSRYTSPWGRA